MAGKRVKRDSKFQPRKRADRNRSRNDRISQLSDDILVDILSLLPLEEAARTSVLSSRWINLWKHTSVLDFDAWMELDKIAKIEKQLKLQDYCFDPESALPTVEEHRKLLGVERRKYVTWVNRVIRSHKADTLKEFRVCFDLSKSSSKSITRWLEFALARHVQKLKLNFSSNASKESPQPCYAFPKEFLTPSSGGASKLKASSGGSYIDFKSLKQLSMKGVNMSGETIEILLRMCPLLEKLVVAGTEDISNLEVCGPSLVLKHLEIRGCFRLESVKISAPNLTTLIVSLVVGKLLLENVPVLVEVSVCDFPCYYPRVLDALSCCISQLLILTMTLEYSEEEDFLSTLPEFPKLKKLVINYCTEADESLMGFTLWIRAAPNLEEFVIDLSSSWSPLTSHEVNNTVQFPHHHLKVLRFYGYYGGSSDTQLVRYILENSVVLEKIIIVPLELFACDEPPTRQELDEIQTTRDYAKQQLEARVPEHVELVIV